MSARHIFQHLCDRRAGIVHAEPPQATSFLTPDTIDPGRWKGPLWIPPGVSIASRIPSARSRGSCRGASPYQGAERSLVFESNLERGFQAMLQADRNNRSIQDQPPAVTYLDRDGRSHRHTFDFRVVTIDGKRVAYAVKPSAKVAKSGIREILEAVEKQIGARFADSYELRTDAEITPHRTHDAREILHYRRARNEADVQEMRRFVSTLRGRAKLRDVARASAMDEGRAWAALVNLIDVGEIALAEGSHIGDLATIRFRTLTESVR
jgi:hypothetical protein